MHVFFNFQLETCWSRVEDFKTIFWTKGATRRQDVHECEWQSVYWFHQYNKHYSPHMKTCRRLASWFGAKVPIPAGYDRESLSSSSLANNRLMDVTQLALTWLGWPNGEKLALTWIAWKFGLDQSEFKLSQVNARAGKAWPNVVASRPKFSTCVCLRLRLAGALSLGEDVILN